MPGKNIVKIYIEDGYYHIYNRGVNKRSIFKDLQDKNVFLGYLRDYLSPPPDKKNLVRPFTIQGVTFNGARKTIKNYSKEVTLIAYCLMPNHFHLLIKQNRSPLMAKLIQSLLTRYGIYFNKKYNRVGPLFQGTYKASLIDNEQYLLWLSRYIHRNPIGFYKDLSQAHSSYANYLKLKDAKWLHPEIVLDYFGKQSYKDFVEDAKKDNEFMLTDFYTLESDEI